MLGEETTVSKHSHGGYLQPVISLHHPLASSPNPSHRGSMTRNQASRGLVRDTYRHVVTGMGLVSSVATRHTDRFRRSHRERSITRGGGSSGSDPDTKTEVRLGSHPGSTASDAVLFVSTTSQRKPHLDGWIVDHPRGRLGGGGIIHRALFATIAGSTDREPHSVSDGWGDGNGHLPVTLRGSRGRGPVKHGGMRDATGGDVKDSGTVLLGWV